MGVEIKPAWGEQMRGRLLDHSDDDDQLFREGKAAIRHTSNSLQFPHQMRRPSLDVFDSSSNLGLRTGAVAASSPAQDWASSVTGQGRRRQEAQPTAWGPDTTAPPRVLSGSAQKLMADRQGLGEKSDAAIIRTGFGDVVDDLAAAARRTGQWPTQPAQIVKPVNKLEHDLLPLQAAARQSSQSSTHLEQSLSAARLRPHNQPSVVSVQSEQQKLFTVPDSSTIQAAVPAARRRPPVLQLLQEEEQLLLPHPHLYQEPLLMQHTGLDHTPAAGTEVSPPPLGRRRPQGVATEPYLDLFSPSTHQLLQAAAEFPNNNATREERTNHAHGPAAPGSPPGSHTSKHEPDPQEPEGHTPRSRRSSLLAGQLKPVAERVRALLGKKGGNGKVVDMNPLNSGEASDMLLEKGAPSTKAGDFTSLTGGDTSTPLPGKRGSKTKMVDLNPLNSGAAGV